jgi:uncharacterized SAM-binding protein YcdF (DUF218 family)
VSRIRRGLAGLAALALFVWLMGLAWFVWSASLPARDAETQTDAVVVLTGGSLRVGRGVQLLAAGKAQKLFVSGVHHGVDADDMLRLVPGAPAWLTCCIELGHDADNTEGNARETAAWLRQEGYHSLRLVTANYHMPRALLELTHALPPGIRIIPDPVFPEGARPGDLWSLHGTARLILVEYVKYLGALIRLFVLPEFIAIEPASQTQT